MAEIGEVVEVNDGVATVKLKRVEACAKCKACTAGMSEQEMLLTGRGEDLQVGDTVSISLSSDKMLRATYTMYGIPLVAMLVGFVLGFLLIGELGSFIIGMFSLGLSYFCIRAFEKKRNREDYMPHLTKV